MTDEWARPSGEHASHDAIEIELDGPGGPEFGDDDGVSSPPEHVSNWRKIVGLSSVAGVAMGVVVAVVIATTGGDADDESTPTTTVDPDAVSEITTPPTLPPVVDEPRLGPGPTAPTSQTLDLFREPDEVVIETSGLDLPDFASVDFEPGPGRFELTAASFAPESDVRSTVTIHRSDGSPETILATYDAATGRMEMHPVDDPAIAFLIDPAGESLYSTNDGLNWERVPATVLDEGIGMTIGDYVRSIVTGPLRASTYSNATLRPTRFVSGDDGETLREFDVELTTDALPEWEVFYDSAAMFSDEATVTTVRFVALVAADGMLRRVDGLNATADGSAVLSSHVITLGAGIEIELPPDDAVSEMSFDEPIDDDVRGPEYLVVGESDLAWADVDTALADFAPPGSVTITEWYPEGTATTQLQRSDDGRTRAFRQLTRPSPLAIVEQITDPTTGTTYVRDEDDPDWRTIEGDPPLGVIDDSSFALLIDADVLRTAGPAPTVELVLVDGDITMHRAQMLLQPEILDGATSTITAESGIAGRPTLVDILLSDGAVIGLRLTPFDETRSVVIEQRFEPDAILSINLPIVGN